MTRRLATALLALLALPALAQTYGGNEIPPYEVVAEFGEAEVRAYAPYIVAEVTVEGDRDTATEEGFRILADYIFGANEARSDIAMTAPVGESREIEMTAPVGQSREIDMTTPVGQSGGEGEWTITFTMPSDWTLDTLPIPDSDRIDLREVDAHREAVWRFDGVQSDATLDRAEAELRAALDAAGIAPEGPPRWYFYDDPSTPADARRNEVAFTVSGSVDLPK